MNPPLVSICIPTYNGSQHLEVCLDSVLSQSYTNFEIIIVDDQSSDDTCDILNRYAVRDRRIHLSSNPQNLGLVGNWNRCLELAQGEWIKFVFQDDWITSNCIERMVSASVGSQSMLVVCQRKLEFEGVSDLVSRSFLNYTGKYSPSVVFQDKRQFTADEFCDQVLQYQTMNFLGEPTAMLFHRDAILRFGKFNPDLIQLCDLEYWFKIGINTGIIYVPETLACFRVHGNSATSSNDDNRAYAKDVIDPLRLRCEYAFGSHFQPLRQAALAKGCNLKLVFLEKLLNEQIEVYRTHPHLYEEWRKLSSAYSCMKIPTWLPNCISIWVKRLERKLLNLSAQYRHVLGLTR
ncbi:MAG: glycosyltransferase [Methylococcales bacterium]|nr:glycosyltransferase [Methylococcales bacterium]